MLEFLVWGLILYVLYRMLTGKKEVLPDEAVREKPEETYRDPVCGTYITEESAVIGRLDGERIHFCSRTCLDAYSRNLENNCNHNETGRKE